MSLIPGMEKETYGDVSSFTIYWAIMVTLSQRLLPTLILVLAYKLNRLVAKLDQLSRDAGKFVQRGLTYFKKRQ